MKKWISFLIICIVSGRATAQGPSVKLLVDNGRYEESEWVRQLAVSSDDKYLLVSDFSSGLRIYELETGTLLNLFEGHSLEGDIYYDAGNNILVTTGDKKIKIWDIAKQALIKEIRQGFHSQFMNDVYIDSKRKFVFAQRVKYDFAGGKQVKTYPFSRMYFFEDKYYTFNPANGNISQYDVYTDRQLRTYPIERYDKGFNIFFNENKGLLFIGYNNGVRVVNIETGKSAGIPFNREYNFDNLSICANFDFSRDMSYFIATSHQGQDNRIRGDGHLVILAANDDKTSYREIYRDLAKTNEVLALHHSNRAVVSRTESFELIDLDKVNQPGFVVWDKSSPDIKNFSQLLPADNNYMMLKFGKQYFHVLDVISAMGKTYTPEKAEQFFDLSNGSNFRGQLGFCTFKKELSSAEIPAELMGLWKDHATYAYLNLVSGKLSTNSDLLKSVRFTQYGSLPSEYGTVEGKNYSPSGNIYAIAGSFSDVSFFRNNTKIVSAPANGVMYHVEYSRDEKYAAFGGSDKTITVVDLANKRKLFAAPASSYVQTISFSPDNKYVFSGSLKNEILMHDMLTGKVLKKFSGSNGKITDLEISNDGRVLFSTAEDNALRLWDIKTGALLVTLYIDYNLNYLAFTPDGYFDKSESFAGGVAYNVNGNLISFDQLYEKYYRPDIIKSLLYGDTPPVTQGESINKGVKSPPLLDMEVTGPGNRGVILSSSDYKAGEKVELSLTARDNGGGVKGIRVYNNKKLIEEKMLPAALFKDSLQLTVQLELSRGVNLVEAMAIADDYTESRLLSRKIERVVAAGNPVKPNLYILSMGANEYRNTRYNLNYCIADMESFSDSLQYIARNLFGSIVMKSFRNREATKENIRNYLGSIANEIKVNDVFILFYAGHGIALENPNNPANTNLDFYCVLPEVTQMTDPSNCTANGLSGTELRELLKSIKANKQILFLDACNSGAFAEKFVIRGAAEENALAKLSRASGIAIFASTTKEQFASEFSQLNHGVFTYVLLKAFSGEASIGNCQITAASLKSFIDDQTPVYTEKYKGQPQYPTTFLFGQDFPIGIRCKGK